MAYGRLSEAEAFAGGGQAPQIPNRKEDAQQVEIKVFINLIHTENYNYEFDLHQRGRHRAVMAGQFNIASEQGAEIRAGGSKPLDSRARRYMTPPAAFREILRSNENPEIRVQESLSSNARPGTSGHRPALLLAAMKSLNGLR